MQWSWFHFNPLFSGGFSLGKIIYWKLKCGLLGLHWEVCFCLIIFLWDCIYGNGKENVIKLVLLHFSKAFVFCIVVEYEEVAWGSQGLEPALPQHSSVWCAFSPWSLYYLNCMWLVYLYGSEGAQQTFPAAQEPLAVPVPAHHWPVLTVDCTCNNGIVHFPFWTLSANGEKGAPLFCCCFFVLFIW